MVKVTSSNIEEIGYTPETKVLEVLFKAGGTYKYYDVPQEVYDDFVKAESVGKYFQANVKGVYEFIKEQK
jgi:hypothetical protein